MEASSSQECARGGSHRDRRLILQDIRSFKRFLDGGALADIRVKLPGGIEVAAHRVVLAAASDVLRAKFEAGLQDANEPYWEPEVGSAVAWRWVLGWMYGYEEPLQPELLVEALLLADRFQIESLVNSILALPIEKSIAEAEVIVQQLLRAWVCPESAVQVAKRCVPLVGWNATVCGNLKEARPENISLILRFLPVLTETDRLRLIGEYLRKAMGPGAEFPPCFMGAVRWESLPAALLEAILGGDATKLEVLTASRVTISANMRAAVQAATLQRCRNLEGQVTMGGFPAASAAMAPEGESGCEGYVLPLGADHLLAKGDPLCMAGLFAYLAAKDLAEVVLSSAHRENPEDPAALFKLHTWNFGTDEQGAEEPPWIQIRAKACRIQPTAIALKHGWNVHRCDYCTSFVVEAAAGDTDPWETLLQETGHALSKDGEVFELPQLSLSEDGEQRAFDRFRLRMTGPNSSSRWYMMVAWFDVFGYLRTPPTYYVSGLCDDEAT